VEDLELVLEPQHVGQVELEHPVVAVALERGSRHVAREPDAGVRLVRVGEAKSDRGHRAAS
jgi:hypothetical protein